jgi:hypothetical protein
MPNTSRYNSQKTEKEECGKCGYTHYSTAAVCPAKGQQCEKCSRFNHYAQVCKSRSTPYGEPVHYVAPESENEDDQFYVGYIDTVNAVDLSEWQEYLKINNKQVAVQLDTGAKCNVMSLKTFQNTEVKEKIQATAAQLKSNSGHAINIHDTATLLCKQKDNTYKIKFFIAEADVPSILSAQTCTELKLVQRVNKVSETLQSNSSEKRPDILREYSDLFKGLACLPGKHTIRIDSTVKPVVHPPRRVPITLKDRIEEGLDRMEKTGVIEKQR